MEKIYTQPEAALALGFKNYRSLNKLIKAGELECIKRSGRNGRKVFSEKHLEKYLKSKMV
jgi:predicted DNA-binding ArsR family transcriptional regulator